MKKTSMLFYLFILTLGTAGIHAQQIKENKLSIINTKQAGAFPIVTGKAVSSIYFDASDAPVVRIAAQALKEDIKLVSGTTASLDSSNIQGSYSVIIGTIGKSRLIDQLIKSKKLNVSAIKGGWERFTIAVIDQPFSKIKQALVIAGSDPRGTAFGVFELSKMMGVSPWYWWADITPEHQKALFVTKGTIISDPPSVKYRGIFLNDEDWGLQPWAAKTFEPGTGDIGPKTYAKIFELLLRLKANLIWPAMHPSTKAFYYYPGNPQVAADYDIVVGTSHAEPMLRNNVDEWNEKTMGRFNYITNKEKVYSYWEERVKQSKAHDAVYTLGMRGVHDSGMEGIKDPKDAVPLLERIIADQRELLGTYVSKDITAVPQAFTAYKEVLDIYDKGLKLPDDVTLVWPDDNYGYIQRLNNEEEEKRQGGAGVYYHASYWGRPHDYLWLSSTHPSLIRGEMMKAYETGADRLWVLNVGDIKPLEYNIELFLDMAYDARPFKDSRYVRTHLNNWVSEIFGKEKAEKMGSLLWNYYQLAFERKPEFMGWSRTEPTTQTTYTEYNHFFYGDEAQRRIDRYEVLEKEVKALRTKVKANRADAYYQLVYYPVVGASWMNKKFLYRDKAAFYAKQNRLSARDYASLSQAAYDSIMAETECYNNKLANGKWQHMMSYKPRNLPVYLAPVLNEINIDSKEVWSIAPESYINNDSAVIAHNRQIWSLPPFDRWNNQSYFIDVYLSDEQSVSWKATTSSKWIKLSQDKGVLKPGAGKSQMRIWVEIDWSKAPKDENLSGNISFKGAGKQMIVEVQGRRLDQTGLSNYKSFIENNGFVSMHAANFSRQTNKQPFQWKVIDDLGYTGKTMQALPLRVDEGALTADGEAIQKNSSCLEYDFYTFTAATPELSIFTLPTHPLNNKYSMRYAVSVDDGPVKIVDFRTFGRSEEWKQNVLRNRAERKIQMPFLDKGAHTLKIYCVDPGVTLDEISIDLGGLKKAYSTLAETKLKDAPKTALK